MEQTGKEKQVYCSYCEQYRNESDFHKSKKYKLGRMNKCKFCISLWSKRKFQELKLDIMTHYCGGVPHCQCPGCYYNSHPIDMKFLTIDHKNGNGMKMREVHGTGSRFYLWIVRNNYPTELQVLCYNCNMAKRANPECPHVLGVDQKPDVGKLYLTRRNNGYFYVGYMDNGRRRWVTSKCTDETSAREFQKDFGLRLIVKQGKNINKGIV